MCVIYIIDYHSAIGRKWVFLEAVTNNLYYLPVYTCIFIQFSLSFRIFLYPSSFC